MYVSISDWSKSRPFYSILKWFGVSTDNNHKFHDWLKSLHLIEHDQRIKIRVDEWDTWNADVTMAKLITAILTKYRADMYGWPPNLDPSDANDFEDELAWDYIVDEIIYVFSHYEELLDYGDDYVANKARFDNGARLFAKYFTGFWI